MFSLLAFSQAGKSQPSAGQPSVSSVQASQDPAKMTDAQIIKELMENLNKREASIAERESLTARKESRLTERENDLILREANYQEKLSLLETRKQLLIETESYWKSYKSETFKDKAIAFGIGFAGGVVFGGYSGFKIGVATHY